MILPSIADNRGVQCYQCSGEYYNDPQCNQRPVTCPSYSDVSADEHDRSIALPIVMVIQASC